MDYRETLYEDYGLIVLILYVTIDTIMKDLSRVLVQSRPLTYSYTVRRVTLLTGAYQPPKTAIKPSSALRQTVSVSFLGLSMP